MVDRVVEFDVGAAADGADGRAAWGRLAAGSEAAVLAVAAAVVSVAASAALAVVAAVAAAAEPAGRIQR